MYKCLQKIRFDDVDGAGIVYYPRFFHLCHKTFEDFFNEEAEITYPIMINQLGIGFPTVKIASEFLKPLYYGDEVLCYLGVNRIGRASVDCSYRFLRARDEALSFKAEVVVVCMDLAKKTSLPIPINLRDTFAKIMADPSP